MLFLVDDLDTKQGTTLPGLDVGLAALKEALGCAKDLMQCPRCQTKPECMTVLTFLIGKLTNLCEVIAAEYATSLKSTPDVEGEGSLLPWLMGDYEADSTREWHAVMEALLRLQLRDLYSVMNRMIDISAAMQLGFACKKLDFAQKRIAILLQRQ